MNGIRKKPAAPEALKAAPAKRPTSSTATQARHSPKAAVAEAALSPIHEQALAAMRRKLAVARYSPRSIQVYLSATRQLFQDFPNKHPNDIRTEDIDALQNHLPTVRKVNNSTLNQAVNAIRYYYMNVVGDAKRVTFMERPLQEKKLPTVLSEEEVADLLRSVEDLRHRCILMLICSAGLRLSELIALEPGTSPWIAASSWYALEKATMTASPC